MIWKVNFSTILMFLNTLRTGEADLRF